MGHVHRVWREKACNEAQGESHMFKMYPSCGVERQESEDEQRARDKMTRYRLRQGAHSVASIRFLMFMVVWMSVALFVAFGAILYAKNMAVFPMP